MSVQWSEFDKFVPLEDKYLPDMGEGDSKATQLCTAVTKLVYKWYNDGDVYDNTGYLEGWANDLSSYANWIYKYIPRARDILDRVFDCYNDSMYEDLLWDLCELTQTEEYLGELAEEPKVGTIYDCDGPFEFREDYGEDEEDWDEGEEEEEEEEEEEGTWEYDWYHGEDDDIESSTEIDGAEKTENEALQDVLRNMNEDFDFIVQGLEKLDRSGAEDSRIALEIAEKFSGSLQETISAISERLQ